MSKAEREHWEQRYSSEGVGTTEPTAFLREIANRLPPQSRVLDVGGGTGRNSLWLAERGHTVTIADISPRALELAGAAAAAADL
ncbi:MAG: methyltransferase domain-containing protein, partial [bacterium]|nr:methyltransferase domain-containing protein [bacterium]